MNDYIEMKTNSSTGQLDLDAFMRSLHYDNTMATASEVEMGRFTNVNILTSYSRRGYKDVNVDYFYGVRSGSRYLPVGYPKDGVGQDGRAIWESCFVVSFLTRRAIERGKAKKIILPAFETDASVYCDLKTNMRAKKSIQIARCSRTQLEGLRAILNRYENTHDEDGIEFSVLTPCELVIQNG